MKTLKLLGTSALVAALAAPAFASGPEVGDSFTVSFNGRTGLDIYYVIDDSAATSTSDSLRMEQQYTRFGFTANGDTAMGAFKARIEGDFQDHDVFRIRHAYGQVGPILAGQTDSLLRTGMPYVSDWGWSYGDVTSLGNNYGRTQQLRYTTSMGGVKLAVALEDNASLTEDFFDITANAQFAAGPASITAVLGLQEDGDVVVGGAASFSLGFADAFVTANYFDSNGGTGLGGIVNTAGDTGLGLGAGAYFPAGDNLSAFVGGSVASSGDTAAEQTYLTASLTWSPMPQYSIIGQLHYIDTTTVDAVSSAATQSDQLVFDNRWMYKF
ncbi:hypothetical protein N9K16_01580 [Alphaproteobacteria bacterium]|nr:hypothetical protein [Alphaproteobacteria bacterium]